MQQGSPNFLDLGLFPHSHNSVNSDSHKNLAFVSDFVVLMPHTGSPLSAQVGVDADEGVCGIEVW
jgi:hypothetical protein